MANVISDKSRRLKQLLKERNGMVPVWVRAPSHGPEFFSGFSRAKLYQLAAEGRIKTKSIHDPGKERGTRLFHLGSILELIDSVPDDKIEASEAA